ncbi:MAG: hypothetical protein IKW39_03245, partial [Alphaproteobacteria bacterium]|nr:hypothetical protein [Alphaproteobacteria bacterium]
MNSAENIEKLKAKSKVNVLVLLLIFAVVGGGVWEYNKYQAPLADVLVVYSSSLNNGKQELNQNTGETNTQKIKVTLETETKDVKKTDSNEAKKADEVIKKDVVVEFKEYIEEVNEAISKEAEIRLDKIILPEVKEKVVKEVKEPVVEVKE